MSNTYSVTRWRAGWVVGWVPAPPGLIGSIGKVHDFLTVGAAPLRQAGVLALVYYWQLSPEYAARGGHLVTSLQDAGFKSFIPHGAYYVMTDISDFGFAATLPLCAISSPTSEWRQFPGRFFFECKRWHAKCPLLFLQKV